MPEQEPEADEPISPRSQTESQEDVNLSERSSTVSDSSVGSDLGVNLMDRNFFQKFIVHLHLLLQKQFIQLIREKRSLISMVFNPIAWCFVIYYFNQQGYIRKSLLKTSGELHLLEPIEPCYGDNCVTLGYSIVGDPDHEVEYTYIDEIMQNVAENNDLLF